jgi:hypothetical protein
MAAFGISSSYTKKSAAAAAAGGGDGRTGRADLRNVKREFAQALAAVVGISV